MYEHERSTEHGDAPKDSQYEQLRLTSETELAAFELVTQLATQNIPTHQSLKEYSINKTLHPDLVKIPEALQIIPSNLGEVSVRYEHIENSDRTKLTLRLSFDDDWHVQISRPEHCDNERPFEGEIIHLTSSFGPRALADSQPYAVTVSVSEIAHFMQSLLSRPFDPSTELINDPQEIKHAQYIQDVLRESRGANIIQELSYRINVKNDEYEVETSWVDNTIAWIEINQFIYKDIHIENGTPKESSKKIVARIDLESTHRGIRFYAEVDGKPGGELEQDSGMIQRVYDIVREIQSTLHYVTELQTDGQALDENSFDTPDTSA